MNRDYTATLATATIGYNLPILFRRHINGLYVVSCGVHEWSFAAEQNAAKRFSRLVSAQLDDLADVISADRADAIEDEKQAAIDLLAATKADDLAFAKAEAYRDLAAAKARANAKVITMSDIKATAWETSAVWVTLTREYNGCKNFRVVGVGRKYLTLMTAGGKRVGKVEPADCCAIRE